MATMTPAERFFWKHAGYSYDPATETKAQGRRRCASLLAEAEAWAKDHELTFTWEHDPFGELGDHEAWCEAGCGRSHEILLCLARYRDGEVAASLSGIIDPDRNYARVIEAELALEARAETLASVFEAI